MTEQERLEKNKRIKESGKATRERRKHQTCKCYLVKIDESRTGKKTMENIKRVFAEAKWLYNDILSFSENNDINDYDIKTKTVTVLDKDKQEEIRELRVISGQMKQMVLYDIKSSIKGLSVKKKSGYKVGILKYKSNYDSIDLIQYGRTYKIKSRNSIRIQNIGGNIICNGLKQFIGNPNIEFANAKLLKRPTGYYIMITTYQDTDTLPIKKYIGSEIGIDMGIKDNITLSNGKKFNVSIEESERLKRLHLKLIHQRKGSNNRHKTKLKIQKEYEKLNNKKNDMANKIYGYINSFEHIYMQDENLTGWKNGLFGKQVHHSIMGRIKKKLINNKRVIVLARNVPTTKYCPICGTLNNIGLEERIYNCSNCNYSADRDIHAANNMIMMSKIIENNNIGVPMGGREFRPVRCDYSATSSNCVVEQEDSKLYTSCITENYKGCINNSSMELCI